MIKFCDDCIYLSPTEAEQDADPARPRKPHICNKGHVILKHGIYHPKIPALSDCGGPYRGDFSCTKTKPNHD